MPPLLDDSEIRQLLEDISAAGTPEECGELRRVSVIVGECSGDQRRVSVIQGSIYFDENHRENRTYDTTKNPIVEKFYMGK